MKVDAIEEINKEDNKETKYHKSLMYLVNANKPKDLIDKDRIVLITYVNLVTDQIQYKIMLRSLQK